MEKRKGVEEVPGAVYWGAKDIYNILLKSIADPDGRINVKPLLFYAGALTGISCQMAVWEEMMDEMEKTKKVPADRSPVLVETKTGLKYYMGDAVNYYLYEAKYSVWSLVAGLYHNWEPDKPVPDLKQYVVASVENLGKADYRIWGEANPFKEAENCKKMWDAMYNKTKQFCKSPGEWPILYGLALQSAMNEAVEHLGKRKCFDMTMENVLYMSKMDYRVVTKTPDEKW